MSVHDVERDRVLLLDGRVVGRYHLYPGRPPVAEFFERVGDVVEAVHAVLDELAGWTLTTSDDQLATELTTRGASETRRFSVMTVDLTGPGGPSGGASGSPPSDRYEVQTLRPDTVLPEGMPALVRAAYPPGHPDQELGTDAEIVRDLRHALDGSRLGPLMSSSRLVLDAGRPVAVALVNRVSGHPPAGGPWLTDLFREPGPAHAGLGQALLTDVLAAARASRERAVSLAVTEGNGARRLYESLGFDTVAELRKLRLPT
jgi:GNAT superfamily N-acetyltransferase